MSSLVFKAKKARALQIREQGGAVVYHSPHVSRHLRRTNISRKSLINQLQSYLQNVNRFTQIYLLNPSSKNRFFCNLILHSMPPSKSIKGLFQANKRLRTANSGGKAVWVTSENSNENAHYSQNTMQSDQIVKASALEVSDTHYPSSPLNSEDNGSQILKEAAQMQLSPQQVMRMEMNKSLARAKRIQKICDERVTEARAKGMPFPKLEDLLVVQSWLDALPSEFQKPYMQKLSEFVTQESRGSTPIYPPPPLIFNALNSCPFDKVKVVILGQDPYHGPGQAMGLCFSVPNGIKMPSSLVNIYKEIQQDVGCSFPSHGNLERWAVQGVVLLNTVLTVRAHQANSHAKRGWEVFTDAVIRAISMKKSDVIFLLWGNSAQEKIRIIDTNKHHILKAAHPSGLSAHRGFFQCRHFSQANKILEQSGLTPIDWQI